ncbi:MAG: redox-sensing transcriptional repressor Rex [Polyangia bacterium]
MNANEQKLSGKTIERLSRYRRELEQALRQRGEKAQVFSHELAEMCGYTAAQVRRDLMAVGHSSSTSRGYDCRELVCAISETLGRRKVRRMVLVGAGRLGRALLGHFVDRRHMFAPVAVFDHDGEKIGKMIHGVPCHAIDDMEEFVRRERVRIAILTMPAKGAQEMAERLVHSGVRGILNFAPIALRVPSGVFVENTDISVTLEKVAFFAGGEAPVGEEGQ